MTAWIGVVQGDWRPASSPIRMWRPRTRGEALSVLAVRITGRPANRTQKCLRGLATASGDLSPGDLGSGRRPGGCGRRAHRHRCHRVRHPVASLALPSASGRTSPDGRSWTTRRRNDAASELRGWLHGSAVLIARLRDIQREETCVAVCLDCRSGHPSSRGRRRVERKPRAARTPCGASCLSPV